MAERPNLLLFMPDQLRADCVGAFGNPVVQTPNLDALAARGTSFRQAWGQHSVCGPSRVSMFTGWYPHVQGHRTLDNLIKPWEPNLLRLLRESGYHVAWAGLRGDTFAPGVTQASTDRWGFVERPKAMFGKSPFEPEHPLARAFYHGRRPEPMLDFDEAAVRTAEAWLADGLPEPWVLFVALLFPHPPFEVEEPFYSLHDRASVPEPAPPLLDDKPRFMRAIRDSYGTARLSPDDWAEIVATYYGMVARVDHQLGRVLEAVARAGAEARTDTLFFTDHGEYLGDYGLVEKWPSGLHECLLRNPFVWAGPSSAEANVCSSFVEMVDLLPSLAEIAGAEVRHSHFGRSLLPLLRDGSRPHRDAAFSEGGFSLAEEPLLERARFPYDKKSELQHADPVSVGRAISLRTERWTYVRRLYERDELYDREHDPRELQNRIDEPRLASTAEALRARVLDWLLQTADVIPWENDPRFEAELWNQGSGVGEPLGD
jgi:arylsulfatase A-like enzyme